MLIVNRLLRVSLVRKPKIFILLIRFAIYSYLISVSENFKKQTNEFYKIKFGHNIAGSCLSPYDRSTLNLIKTKIHLA